MEVDQHAIAKAEASMFRAKAQYVNEGEKMSKYFFSLEKKRYLEKNMQAIFDNEGNLTHNQHEILCIQTDFYKSLYSKDSNIHFSLTRDVQKEKGLNELEKSTCEQALSEGEVFDDMMTLRSGRTPGVDGLTIEFYGKFYNVLKVPLLNMYNFAIESGLLPLSTRRGAISLLPKKGKDGRYVKNKRPLTLLNNDYKILAKAWDNWLCSVLPDHINPDQTGFLVNRNIACNIRKSLDLIEYCKATNIPAVIMSIDMEKCFDRVDYSAVLGALKYFNFGSYFIQVSSIFFADFQFCIQNFGNCSDFYSKYRSINQGCPYSPSLYLLIGEILANKLRNNSAIKGIKVNDIEYLISQFADDMDLYLPYDLTVLNAVINTLAIIESNTGLKVSYDKTTLFRIGSIAHTDAKCYTQKKIKWSNDYINTLGIDLFNNNEDLCKNFQVYSIEVESC